MNLLKAIKECTVEEVEKILICELQNESQNGDLWIKLALTELQFPFEDFYSALQYIEKTYELGGEYITSLILESAIKWHNCSIDEKLYKKLDKVQCEDKGKMSIIYYLQSLYYYTKQDRQKEMEKLKKSIELCDEYVYPFKDLGYILNREGKKEAAYRMLMKAKENVKKVYKEKEFYDYTNADVYIAEFVTGTEISEANYECILKDLEKYSL